MKWRVGTVLTVAGAGTIATHQYNWRLAHPYCPDLLAITWSRDSLRAELEVVRILFGLPFKINHGVDISRLCELAGTDCGRTMIVKHGGIECLVEHVLAPSASPRIVVAGVDALNELFNNDVRDSVADEALQRGGLPLVVLLSGFARSPSQLFSEDKTASLTRATAVADLRSAPDEVVNKSLIPLLLSLSRTECSETEFDLTYISTLYDEWNEEDDSRATVEEEVWGIVKLLDTFKQADLDVHYHSIRALATLAAVEENRVAILKANGVELLVRLYRLHKDEERVCIQSARAFANLAMEQGAAERMIACGLLPDIIQWARDPDVPPVPPPHTWRSDAGDAFLARAEHVRLAARTARESFLERFAETFPGIQIPHKPNEDGGEDATLHARPAYYDGLKTCTETKLQCHAARFLANMAASFGVGVDMRGPEARAPEKCGVFYDDEVYRLFPLQSASSVSSRPLPFATKRKRKGSRGVDVVFVHGLQGAPITTWRSILPDGPICWPKEWLAEDMREGSSQDVRFLSIGYRTYLSMWSGSSLRREQRSKQILRKLQRAQVGVDRDVVFVTHSMGGLVAKQLLVDASESSEYANLAGATRGIVFIGTPHAGSWISILGDTPAIMPTHEVSELKQDSPELKALNKQFARLARGGSGVGGIRCLSLGESLPTTVPPGSSSPFKCLIVPEVSSNPGFGHFHLVEHKDHLQIVRPLSKDDPVYVRVLSFLREFL